MILAEPGRTQWDLKWRMFKIPLRVHPAFWLVALIFSYEEGRHFSFVVISMACMFVSIVVHEYGHAFSGRYYGDNQNHTVLYWAGGLCVPGRGVPERWPRIAQLLWGPGAGFILGGIAAALYFTLDLHDEYKYEHYIKFTLYYLIWINGVWGLMNLFPVFPLDGGQICREIIRWKSSRHGDVLALTISIYTAIALIAGWIGYLIYLSGHGYKFDGRQLWPIFLFGSLAYSSYRARQQAIMYGDMDGYPTERREAWEQDPDWWKRGGR
jgi:stage IV sporulation protein FB